MKRLLQISLLLINFYQANAQDNSFYAKGYLLYGKDTTPCKIWITPPSISFDDTLFTWQNEQEVIVVATQNEKLTGFGITETGYATHFGRVKLASHHGMKIYVCKKIVTGVAELYEYPYLEITKAPDSYQLEHQKRYLYFIGRTDSNPAAFPVLLNPPKKKTVAAVLKGFQPVENADKNIFSPEELVNLVIQFNNWYPPTKKQQ